MKKILNFISKKILFVLQENLKNNSRSALRLYYKRLDSAIMNYKIKNGFFPENLLILSPEYFKLNSNFTSFYEIINTERYSLIVSEKSPANKKWSEVPRFGYAVSGIGKKNFDINNKLVQKFLLSLFKKIFIFLISIVINAFFYYYIVLYMSNTINSKFYFYFSLFAMLGFNYLLYYLNAKFTGKLTYVLIYFFIMIKYPANMVFINICKNKSINYNLDDLVIFNCFYYEILFAVFEFIVPLILIANFFKKNNNSKPEYLEYNII